MIQLCARGDLQRTVEVIGGKGLRRHHRVQTSGLAGLEAEVPREHEPALSAGERPGQASVLTLYSLSPDQPFLLILANVPLSRFAL